MWTVQLGDCEPPADAAPERKLEAAGILLSGLVSAAALTLYATGYHKQAAALGAAGVIVGAISAAARSL